MKIFKKKNYGQIYTAPLMFWITVFFVIPILIIFVFSFLKKSYTGGVLPQFSLDAYGALANPQFVKVVLKTLFISIVASIFTVLLAIPTSYYIARSKYKDILLFLIIIPFWTNFLIRIYAWIAILGNNGFVNNFLINIGLIEEHVQLLYNQWAVIIVIVYAYLPFAILPLYSTIEKFDFSLLEAARDLGATKFQSIMKVMIPNIKPGITTAVLFTFIPAFGNYAIPEIVGGKDSVMVG
ncbi:MAG: spermidine/putrescine ABC transporter permease, partial [Spirochaetes bacterium GWC1_27_15]